MLKNTVITVILWKTLNLIFVMIWKKRNNDLGNIVFKAAALDPRYKSLKFLSEKTKAKIWEEVKQEIKKNEPEPVINSEPSIISSMYIDEYHVDESEKKKIIIGW